MMNIRITTILRSKNRLRSLER